jgi:hypothetical protein
MFKKLGLIVLLSLVAVYCGGGETAKDNVSETVDETVETAAAPATVSIDNFEAEAEKLVDKLVTVEGTVGHVCRHGGKRMFLLGENPDNNLKVLTGADISAFDVALEGSDVIVEGFVRESRVDEAYLDELEKKTLENMKKAQEEKKEGEASDDHGHDGNADEATHNIQHKDPLKNIKDMKEELKSNPKGYLSFYSIECRTFKVKEETK